MGERGAGNALADAADAAASDQPDFAMVGSSFFCCQDCGCALSAVCAQRLGDLRADAAAPDPFQAMAEENLLERVFERLAELSAEDREVVELFFGIRGRKRASLSDIARARGVTPQRIHVRLHRALRRLRAACAA